MVQNKLLDNGLKGFVTLSKSFGFKSNKGVVILKVANSYKVVITLYKDYLLMTDSNIDCLNEMKSI